MLVSLGGELPNHLRTHWPALREQLVAGTYPPTPVRRQAIPKSNGGKVAANGRRWWKNSAMLINAVFPIRYFDELGLPRLGR